MVGVRKSSGTGKRKEEKDELPPVSPVKRPRRGSSTSAVTATSSASKRVSKRKADPKAVILEEEIEEAEEPEAVQEVKIEEKRTTAKSRKGSRSSSKSNGSSVAEAKTEGDLIDEVQLEKEADPPASSLSRPADVIVAPLPLEEQAPLAAQGTRMTRLAALSAPGYSSAPAPREYVPPPPDSTALVRDEVLGIWTQYSLALSVCYRAMTPVFVTAVVIAYLVAKTDTEASQTVARFAIMLALAFCLILGSYAIVLVPFIVIANIISVRLPRNSENAELYGRLLLLGVIAAIYAAYYGYIATR